jgi:hypothetical protein
MRVIPRSGCIPVVLEVVIALLAATGFFLGRHSNGRN